MPLLRMDAITKRYPGVVANRDVCFELERGEVHGLLGENGAGKTTLMNVLFGLVQPDGGTIHVDDRPVVIRSPKHALELGIGMVHQHFKLVPTLTVAENVALGAPGLGLRFPARRVADEVRAIADRYHLDVDPTARVQSLSVGAQQRVEILKLLYRGAEILVLDEPTAVLTPGEWHELAAVLRALTAEGKGVVFISHKLDEQFAAAQRCTVLRDGTTVGTVELERTTHAQLARLMVGRDVVLRADRPPQPSGAVVLSVRNLTATDHQGTTVVDDLTFEVRSGETLGIAGVDGNGQQELVAAILGLVPSSGVVEIDGTVLAHRSPRAFRKAGGAVVTDDRHRTGVALPLSLTDNLVAPDLHRFSTRGVMRRDAVAAHTNEVLGAFDVRSPGAHVRMRQLSGGNQQKLVLGREMHRAPRLLIAAQPTRGLDVGAMEAVYQRLLDHRARGGATLLISTELEEVLTMADRIAVMSRGRFVRVMANEDVDVGELGLLMAGRAGTPVAP